ncbi:MAG: acylphosphatase [Methylotetracoccus sp.]
MTRRVHLLVYGRVQGVGFRAATAFTAKRLSLVGWVRNRPDGTVEIEAQGPADHIAEFLTWCHRGPTLARVERVVASELVPGSDRDDFALLR